MSHPATDVLAALVITGLAGATLLAALVAANRLLRRIARRLDELQGVLDSIGEATEPLTGRVGAVALNVANLKAAVASFNGVLADRVQAGRHLPADGRAR